MKKYKNIYVNGCSFTAGHELPEGTTWPELVASEYNIRPIIQAKNGQSFESIVINTISQVTKLDPKNTLVLIGLTWPERYLVQFDNFNFNITPADLGRNKRSFQDKLSTWRRISSPYSTDKFEIDEMHNNLNKQKTNYVLSSYVKFYEKLLLHDKNLYKNQKTKYTTLLILLQSFLKDKGYDFLFIKFQRDAEVYYEVDQNLLNNIDKSKILDFYMKDNCTTDTTGHPTAECSILIKDSVIKKLNG